ncbi:hypothetical protein OG601_24950 [Streptomyces sp. NBC_01239]|uniref:hypothetical protein n=1 Tax=Streptomyces sp. NBC_01239 TaxID=2903792 RepID=UPI00224E4EC5|nr:hypothetical protein [Streptomyces sp. NBC_01239]MCX4813849.1 hypothetical protein [Streptomyces sp. NBC_01239]
MTSFVNRYLTETGTTVTTLSAWDGRSTSAVVQQRSGELELLWLVWDLAPRYEIWLRVPVEPDWLTSEIIDPDFLISDFVASHAAGFAAEIEVFDPSFGARPPILLTTTLKIHGAGENLASLIAGQVRNASEPTSPALVDFADIAAQLAEAK